MPVATAPRRPREAPRAVAFAFAATILVIVVLGSQLPSPLYPLYADRLGLAPLAITVLFAVYAAGVLAALLTAGHLSDHAGRRPVLAAALALSAAGDLLFIASPGAYPGLLAARLLSGVAIGLATGTAAAQLAELAPPGRAALGGRFSGVATVVGGGSGALLAGALATAFAGSLAAAYLVHLALLALSALLLAALPETVAARGGARLSQPRIAVDAEARGGFGPLAAGAFCAFAVLGLVSALGASFLRALHHPSPLLAGVPPAAMAVAAVAAPPLLGRHAPRVTMRRGLLALVPSLALLTAAIALRSLPLFLLATTLAGGAFGLAFAGALHGVGTLPARHRGELFSAFYTSGYAGMALPVVAVGALAGTLSLTATVALFSALTALLATLAAARA